MDYGSLLKACSKGFSECKTELVGQLAGPIAAACSNGNTKECRQKARRAALEALAKDQGLPSSAVDLAEGCLDGSRQDCEQLAAVIAAQAACVYYTAGVCPKCCGKVVMVVVDLIWSVVGPIIDGLVTASIALGEVALERLGLKEEPTFRDDVYLPMRKEAEAKVAAFKDEFASAFVGIDLDGLQGEGVARLLLDWELGRVKVNPDAAKPTFLQSSWYPTNYGNLQLNPDDGPFGATWDLEWKTAWERDDAFKAGAKALAAMYGIRFAALRLAASVAAGDMAAAIEAAERKEKPPALFVPISQLSMGPAMGPVAIRTKGEAPNGLLIGAGLFGATAAGLAAVAYATRSS